MKKKTAPKSNKIRTIILSIFLAIIVWLMVVYLTDPDITTTMTDIKVTFVGEKDLRDRGLIITGKDDLPPISAVITGKRSDIINFMDDITLQLDVSSITETGECSVTGKLNMPTTRITVEKEKYGEIPITVEKIAEKDVEVTIKQIGTVKDKLVKSEAVNPIVKITGAHSEIDAVAGAEATVDLSQISGAGTIEVSYALLDFSGALISRNETIESARSGISVTNTFYDAKTVAVEAELTDTLDILYNLKSFEASPSSVTVGTDGSFTGDTLTVYIDKTDGGENEYELTAPDGVYIPDESKYVKIRAELERKFEDIAPEGE